MQELSNQILNDIRNKFEQIEECPVQGKRVFFENAGGALTLKSVVKCSMNYAAIPDNQGRDNAGSHELVKTIHKAKEDMRIFIEEAAGISKYKERRKETSSRIGRTKENLDRLLDVIDEVEKQINHLKRQAKTAEKYKQMRYKERQISASILAIRIRDLSDEAQSLKKLFLDKKLTLESNIAQQRKIEAKIESLRTDQSEKNDNFNSVQANYYKVGSEISRLEQSIEYSNEIRERQKRDLENANENEKEIEDLISQDKKQITRRQKACLNLFKHLSLPTPANLNFPDNQMDQIPLLKIVKKVENKIKKFKPDTIITHYSHCLNVDHKITFDAVITACRPVNKLSVKKILSFEILSSTDWALYGEKQFQPNYFIDISKHIINTE